MKLFAIGRNVLFLALLALAFTIASACATAQPTVPSVPPSVAPKIETDDTSWLTGTCNGKQVVGPYSAINPSIVTIKFWRDGNKIRWELFVTIPSGVIGRGGTSRAEGLATVSGNMVTLGGRYVSGALAGRSLSYTLTKSGDTLEGTGIGASGNVLQMSCTKEVQVK